MLIRSAADAPRRTAIIDLGSNSARVIVMNSLAGWSYHLEDEIREIVRLREGLTRDGLAPEAMKRGLITLRLFQRFCESLNVDHVIATATSAVREAKNGAEFLERVEHETGLKLRILDGDEEARYGVLGALGAVNLENGIVVDIGGGSAQVSQVRGRRYIQGQALTLGALALTERFVHSDPIGKTERKAVQTEIERQLDGVTWLHDQSEPIVGLGGTIRNLAKIEAARQKFPLQNIGGFRLTADSLDETIEELCDLPLDERRKISGLSRDRADIILPGALVIREILERLDQNELTISGAGLREGLFFEEFWRDLPTPVAPDLREFSVLNLARFFGYQCSHADHVKFLSGRLFDQLQPLHELGALERQWLMAAATLHDIGTAIRYNDHHKHSQLLIASNGLPGFTPRETAIIALLTRYHRKGTPSGGEFESLLEKGDEEKLRILASLLRVCEYLERGRSGVVHDVQASWDKKQITLTLVADNAEVEMWVTRRSGVELMETAFERDVVLQSAS